MARIVTIINFKGGVGKTTTAVELSVSLTKYFGRRTLLVDLDPQASATFYVMEQERWKQWKDSNGTTYNLFEQTKRRYTLCIVDNLLRIQSYWREELRLATEEVTQHPGSVWFLTGPLRGTSYPIIGQSITLGSDPGNDIVISNDPAMAPFHARLLSKNGTWYIEKHPQAGALTVNKSPITASTLGDHALVEIGTDTSFLISLQRQAQKEPSDTLTLQAPTAPSLRSEANATQLAVSPATRLEQTEIAPLSSLGLPTLEISGNAFNNRQVYVLDKPVTGIGRSNSNDIAIPVQCVSAQHMQIVREGNQFVLIHPHQEREKTLNGLLYQGRKIRGDEHFSKVLTQGDIFRIGNENGTFVTITYHDGKSSTEDELPPVHPISLRNAEVTIGRLPDNEVVLAHPQVSAHHARLVREGGTYRIIDLDSTNHVYVNGSRSRTTCSE